MQVKYTYEEVIKLPQLPNLSQQEYCEIVGMLIDTGYDRNEVLGVEKGMHFAAQSVVENFSEYWQGVLYYFIANGWASLQRLQNPTGPDIKFSLESKEREKEIFYLRKACSIIERYDHPGLMAQILTNLGNAMDHVGRFVEAIEYWRLALSYVPNFGMAVGNLGFGIFHYAKILYDEGHRFLFCKVAYAHLLNGSASDTVYPDARNGFRETAKMIEARYGHQNLISDVNGDDYSLGRSKLEKEYRRWCIAENLYLNPLNDITDSSIVSHDCFHLPTITAKVDDPPIYHAIYNQLKQEYASARFMLYEGISSTKPHFSDKGNLQIDTLDYAVYSLNTEKVKIAFRMCYSIFDKIAYLLNDYLEVGLKSHEVNFKRVWRLKNAKKELELNPKLVDSQNLALRGLYWLTKDLIASDTESISSILPESKMLADIRNFIEHKSFMVTDMGNTQLVHEKLTLQITREDLEKNTFFLIRLARAAMLYISFAIHIEEQKEEKKLAVPVIMPEMLHQFKT